MAARKLMLLVFLIAPECLAAQLIPEGYYQVAQAENVPAEALYSLALTETSRKLAHGVRPWPWTINVAGKGYRYASRNEAYQALLGFMRQAYRRWHCAGQSGLERPLFHIHLGSI